MLAAASTDPDGFVAGMTGPVVLDEVQRVPDLMRSIKRVVDDDRTPGRFLLTGSADVLTLPRLSESLTGRMEVQRLWPLAQAEVEGMPGTFIDSLFADKLPDRSPTSTNRQQMATRIAQGGFPELFRLGGERRRRAWYSSYLTAILQRDVRDIANVENLAALPRLLTALAARTGSLLSYSDLARSLGMPQTTLKRYFALLEATFLVLTVLPWFTNVGTRLVKSPKVVLVDTGLAAHLLGLDAATLGAAPGEAPPGVAESFGALLESFVATELARLSSWSDSSPELLHFRTHAGREVDLVLEERRRLVGIEVKATASASASDFQGLRALAELAGRRFHRGIVLYLGQHVVPFASNLHAVPMSALWEW